MSIKLLNRVATALAAALIALPAIAADETTDEDEPVMEEVIVTATFRETDLHGPRRASSGTYRENLPVASPPYPGKSWRWKAASPAFAWETRRARSRPGR